MNRKLVLLLSVGSLFAYNEAYANALCKIVPSCESLGYSMKASECAALGEVMLTLKCPFDNSMVYCPEDCQTYPITGTSCDTSKGTCVRCATANRWKYLSCNDGYVLLNGECKPTTCDKNVYVYNDNNKPDAKKGTIVSCKAGTETRYGYSSCNEGWELDGANCVNVDCGADYVVLNKCPNYAECTDTCMSGTTEMTNFKCNDGLIRQGIRCVKNKVGSIYEYNGKPIGVVFYDDGYTTKIIALHDINKNGQAVDKQNSGTKMAWAQNATNADIQCQSYDIEGLSNSIGVADMNGFENTKTILDFANWKNNTSDPRCWTRAARAAYVYQPDVCEADSFCGAGKWYLPALGELAYIYDNYKEGEGTPIYNALNDTEKGVIPFSTDTYYWSSTEGSAGSSWGLLFSSGYRGNYGKGYSGYVRPVLAF